MSTSRSRYRLRLRAHVFVYLDDIIIATSSFKQHFEILSTLAKRITAAKLTISLEKSRFCMQSLKYLGFIISEKGIQPDLTKFEAMMDVGIGAILVQGEKEIEHVIAYFSQKLSCAQRKYQTTERECLTVIQAIEKFRPYIEGIKFMVIVDHASLLWLRHLKDPCGRLGRWALRLQAHDFELKHRKGRFMVVSDALTRAVEMVNTVSDNSDPWYNKLRANIESNSI